MPTGRGRTWSTGYRWGVIEGCIGFPPWLLATCLPVLALQHPWHCTAQVATRECLVLCCTALQNISGLATLLDVRRERAYHFNKNKTEWLALLLNRPQVKAALGADPSKTWVSCCPRVRRRMANDTMKSTKHQIEALLTRLPVLMYQGMFDLKDGAACSEEWMREMAWPHTRTFFGTPREVWAVANETAGYWRAYGSLTTHVVLLGAGHEVPADQTVQSQVSRSRSLVHCSTPIGAPAAEEQARQVGRTLR